MRRLVREEDLLLCGGSFGATIVQLMAVLPETNVEDKLVVVILPDSLRNYLTTFASED